jgi:hypothetical protein
MRFTKKPHRYSFSYRILALVASMGIVYFWGRDEKGKIGSVAVLWLASTWISTIIIGIPIMSAVFGNPQIGKTYGLLAAVSSFIFQLPLLLLLFECDALEKTLIAANAVVAHEEEAPSCTPSQSETSAVDVDLISHGDESTDKVVASTGVPSTTSPLRSG